MANQEDDSTSADVTEATGIEDEENQVQNDPGVGESHNVQVETRLQNGEIETEESVVGHASQSFREKGGAGGKENMQGPHRWRERLRPVRRSDGRRLTGIRDSRGTEGSATVDRSDSFDRQWKDGRKLNREDRIDDVKIRERLKSMPGWKKDWTTRKHGGPMVAKHATGTGNVGNGPNSQVGVSNIPVPLTRRRPMSQNTESAFTRNVVNNPVTYSGSRRRLSPHNSFQFRQPGISAGIYSGRRTPSPNTLYDPSTQSEVSNKRIAKVLRARLYLLQQMGPNSFMIGGDSPDHKFKVVIGPQTCTCGKGPHCVHLLFVMLRVFQVRETDTCLWAKTLKNFEVEALFRFYHDRRSLRLAARHERRKIKELLQERQDSNSEELTTPTGEGDTGSGKDEEDTCPICLLEMLEGESLLKCDNGCQNRLHHHCITIWFEECRRQGEALNCPLCRAQWKSSSHDNNNIETLENGEPPTVPPNTRASSPTPEPHDETRLPHAEPIPEEYRSTAEPWIEVFGEELVSCLFSRNWSIRETALRHLSRDVVATLLRGLGEGRSGVMVSPVRQSATHQMLNTCCSILAFMCADPVYKVFVACLRTLRTMMSYTPCRGVQQRQRLQTLLKPIIETILLKCTDGNRRTSQLSISTIVELAKGQAGELSVGREIVNPGVHGLGGLKYVVQCVTETYLPDSVQWQWLLGRMCILERLFEDFSEQFVFEELSVDDEVDLDLDVSTEMTPVRPSGYHFIIAIAQFTIKAVGFSHTRVAKLARRLFLVAAHFAVRDPSATTELETMLANTEARLAPALRRKFRKIVQDNQVPKASSDVLDLPSSLNDSDTASVSVPSPSISPVSTPRCNSPELFKMQGMAHDDTHSDTGGSGSLAPAVPPNTPRHARRARPDPEGSSDIVDSLDMSDPSETRYDPNDEGPADITLDVNLPDAHETTGMMEQRSSEDVIGLAQLEALIDGDLNIASLHSIEEDLGLSENPDLDCSTSVVDQNICEAETTPVSTPRSQTSSLRNSLSTDGVVSLCDAETVNPDQTDTSHRPVPQCQCNTQPISNSHLRRSVSDVETPSGFRSKNNTPGDKEISKPRYSRSVMLTEDLDFRFSPPPTDQPVCFKTEVATPSPKHSPSTTADQAASSDNEYKCKEEVELEEALALAKALDVSNKQDPTPIVPGLTPTDREEVITIRIQPEEKDQDDGNGLTSGSSQDEPKLYFENIHWVKGMLLGTGAYSTCYQARDVKTGVIMAVKQISFCRNSPSEQEKVIEAITEEIHMMSRLNHPNVVRILGATKQGCHFNMFVEWMAGGSVAFLLDQYGAFSEPVIINYVQQVLRGLAYLHDNHILHRDLKGANLLTDSSGQRLRIGDFGAAARLASRSTGAGEFQGQLLGTIAFMAPEVLRGENYGRSCDVWSVGCVIIEMSTRKPPWNAKDVTNHLKLIFKIATSDQPPPIPPNMSPPVRDVLLRCLELNQSERPSAKDLLLHPLFTQYKVTR